MMIHSQEEHIINGMQMVIDNLRSRASQDEGEMRTIIIERDRAQARLRAIAEYDRQVQGMIKANPNLERQWDEFRVLYQFTANEDLLTTAQEKIRLTRAKGENDAYVYCKECKRLKYDDPLYPDEFS